MAPGILGYIGLGSKAPVPDDKSSPVRALPASWYTSEEMFELERRAVFTSKWMLLTSQSRISQPGDWLKFEIAGYEFVVSRDRKGEIHAFHNTCRHRAYPVVEGDQGTARIFVCKYHGWSYGLDGKLAKAPRYNELSGFDKSQNGLFRIHVRVDSKGFIWVNLDASETPEPWENDFESVDMQERYNQYNFEEYVLDHEYEMVVPTNWKLLADNFNECYHCPTSHPDIPPTIIENLDSKGDRGWIEHESSGQKLPLSSTYFYPNTSLTILPHYLLIQRFLPRGFRESAMQYQVFRNKNSLEEDFQTTSKLWAKVFSEDKILCQLAQQNLQRGVFVNGQMHPRLETGPLFFQSKHREVIRAHYKKEQVAQQKIWPVKRVMHSTEANLVSQEDEALCSGLACQTNQGHLDW